MQRFSYLSVPRLSPYTYLSAIDVFQRNVHKHPKKEVFVHRREDGSRISITNEGLDKKSTQLAKYLFTIGVNRGISVGILGPNTIEWVIGELAILKTGAVSVHITRSTKEAEDVMDSLLQANCKYLILESGLDTEMKQAASKIIENVLTWNETNTGKEIKLVQLHSIPGYEHIRCLDDVFAMDFDLDLPYIFPEDPAVVFVTSGSTGAPKMIQYSHFSLIHTFEGLSEIINTPSGNMFNDRPFSWIAGSILTSLLSKSTRIFIDTAISTTGSNSEFIWKVIEEEHCKGALALPYVLQDLCNLKESSKSSNDYFLNSVGLIGQVITDESRRALDLVCRELRVLYGLTEGGYTIYKVNRMVPIKTGICGKPVLGTEIKLIDSEGDTVSFGQCGEVCIRSRMNSQGCFKSSNSHKTIFLPNEWLPTGDIGIIDNDSNLIIVGRTKDIISRGTRKILPCSIEDVVKKMSGLKDVIVIPVPDKRLGEDVCVCFTTASDESTITAEDVKRFCGDKFLKNETLDGLGESPSHFLKVSEIPKLDTGKFNKRALTELAIREFRLS